MDLTSNYAPKKHHQIKKRKINKLFLRSKGICEFEGCGEEVSKSNFEIHHIIPIRFGGTDELGNLVLLCLHCHKKISQEGQRILTWIDQYEKLLFTQPNMSFKRKKKIEGDILYLRKHFLENFKFPTIQNPKL